MINSVMVPTFSFFSVKMVAPKGLYSIPHSWVLSRSEVGGVERCFLNQVHEYATQWRFVL
ncbi:hypothetical protein [Bartonella sp. LB28NMGDW]|uniref:hypothetical protein n=1 Tax=Bartonella sp. LB28NMGDW TaxID=3243549 RepID=UPI0035CFC204